jgi:hypothetical protein
LISLKVLGLGEILELSLSISYPEDDFTFDIVRAFIF